MKAPKPAASTERNLEKRARALVSRLNGLPFYGPPKMTPKSGVVFISEEEQPLVMYRELLVSLLQTRGFRRQWGKELLEEMARSAEDDDRHYPIVVCLDGWVRVCGWLTVLPVQTTPSNGTLH